MEAHASMETGCPSDEVLNTARNCRHYAMCKVDFLGTGVCASGPERGFVAFYPQGRMDLYAALRDGRAPVTAGALAVAESCDLCGRCDYQCYFVTGMRPTRVMRALKEHLAAYLSAGGEVEPETRDALLGRIREIVGEPWATNDPAIAVTYSHDPSPIAVPRLPAYVVRSQGSQPTWFCRDPPRRSPPSCGFSRRQRSAGPRAATAATSSASSSTREPSST
ncbi:hypothetical protein GMST_03340 [Geomonas silvestris]|uniref:Uncharacterized protein n=1 Tax=Geomonas silvestris TaxID=2740184 RepID=A0A6V8ME82_9BACT|nr:hypothetical protein [Geomonas silvestris]GFO58009.1 hypothetical protein GMST_03340 [Geomonas silvestris]